MEIWILILGFKGLTILVTTVSKQKLVTFRTRANVEKGLWSISNTSELRFCSTICATTW